MGSGGSAPLLHRQAGLCPVERLDLALLIDAEHHGMRRRADIEPDDGVELLGEGGVVGQFEGAKAVGGEAVRLPDLLHRRHAKPDRLGHGARRPVRGFVRRRLKRQPHEIGNPRHRRLAGRRVLSSSNPSTPACANAPASATHVLTFRSAP
jgi:hypothetical protein